ncbi:inactive serine/threonine-protein kinase TEX14 isoform X2 [Tiliqua scincoides]|uniref:inactive serine/threonine-protein kinase TEX14 isoform X2 n=1 Tax=Tiliqua scincoides TaxID=71010 RepID=UPI0034623623
MGGDLRIHDKNGKNPQNWAMSAGKESSAQMLEFIQRCTAHMQATLQNSSFNLLRRVDSPRALVCPSSKFGGITQGSTDSPLGRFLKGGNSSFRNIFSFGFGKFYLTSSRQLGYLASLPVIMDKEVIQADDEPTFSFPTGPYMIMTNLMWGGSRITVKELNLKPHQHCSKLRLSDLLLAEQEYSSKLRHPHLLQLMAVCLSSDLEKTRLVYERVNFGTLYSILHERRSEFPIVHMETIVHLLLQVNDALRFLHSHGFIHRTLSSYAVMIVLAGEAKLTNLEYMVESKDGGEHSDLTRVPIPSQLFKWCAPEVILERAATIKSDIYSFCTLMQEALTDTVPWDEFEGLTIKDLLMSGQCLQTDARLPKPYYDIVKNGLEYRQKDRTMNLQDIRYVLKNDLKDLIDSRRNHPTKNSSTLKSEACPDINICMPCNFAIQVETPQLQVEETARIARSFTVSRCAVSSPEMEAAVLHRAKTAICPTQTSQAWDATLEALGNASDVNDSLCSFEINEIYTCCPELCEESAEEEETAGWNSEAQRKSVGAPVGGDEVPLPPAEILTEQVSCSEEEGSSGTEAEYRVEELSEAPKPCLMNQAGRSTNEARKSQSQFEQKFGKCVLNLKICQTFIQQATDSLCRTERKLDELETIVKQCQPHKQSQGELCVPLSYSEAYLEKVEKMLRNNKISYSRGRGFLWKAVGPPTRNYIPPPLRVPGMQRPLAIHSSQVREHELRSEIGSQDTTCWSDFGSDIAPIPRDRGGEEPNYQLLHPGVTTRRTRNRNAQSRRGSKSSCSGDGSGDEDRFCTASAPEIYEAGLRSEERRMAQTEWTMEVKQMAKKAASGHLGLPTHQPPSGWTSDSEAESLKDAFESSSRRERTRREQKAEVKESQVASGIGDNKPVYGLEEENNLKAAFESKSRSGQFPASEVQTRCSITSHITSTISATAEDLCRGQPEKMSYSICSSADISEEFFTPDPDYSFDSSAPQENSEQENSSAEEEELVKGTTEFEMTYTICRQKEDLEITKDGEQQGEQCLHSTEMKHLHSKVPGEFPSTVAASAGTTQSMRPDVVLKEFKEKDASPTDIQDLSDSSGENSCKQRACTTPRRISSPVSASTPLSSASAMTFSSDVTKHNNFCMMTVDEGHWNSQEASVQGCSTCATASNDGQSADMLSALQEPSATFSEPGFFSEPGVQKRSEKIFPANQQSDLWEVPDSEDQELEECEAYCNHWTEETLCLLDETDRAHSTLDNILEGVLRHAGNGCDLHEELLDPIEREPSHTHHGNVEMKGTEEKSSREPEVCAKNAKDPKSEKASLWQRVRWPSPFRNSLAATDRRERYKRAQFSCGLPLQQ